MNNITDIINNILALSNFNQNGIKQNLTYYITAFPGKAKSIKMFKEAGKINKKVNCLRANNKKCYILNKALYQAPLGCNKDVTNHYHPKFNESCKKIEDSIKKFEKRNIIFEVKKDKAKAESKRADEAIKLIQSIK